MKFLILGILIQSMTAFGSHTNIHFVHGANLTARSWSLLQDKISFRSLAVDLPGRNDNLDHKNISLTSSAVALCKSLVGHDTVIVHSQGGAIVNHAVGICPEKKIEKIIYISAVVPLSGEKAFEKLSTEDEENYFKGIEYNESRGSMIITNADKFLDTFAPSASPEMKRYIWMNSVSEPAAIADEVIKYKSSDMIRIKTYYVRTLNDKIVSIDSQNKMIKDMGINNVYNIESDHLPMFTKVDNLSGILNKIISE